MEKCFKNTINRQVQLEKYFLIIYFRKCFIFTQRKCVNNTKDNDIHSTNSEKYYISIYNKWSLQLKKYIIFVYFRQRFFHMKHRNRENASTMQITMINIWRILQNSSTTYTIWNHVLLILISQIYTNVDHTLSNAKPKIKSCIWQVRIDFLH